MATVLYVDDDPAMRSVVRTWLERSGHEVHTADSVADAQRSVAAHAFDGAFIDVWLGDGTGFELYDWIREHDSRLADRVAFVTGDTAPDDAVQHRLRTLGVPVIAKPFDLEQLKGMAARWGRVEPL
jgi:DNA-binding NtrC family response regulator